MKDILPIVEAQNNLTREMAKIFNKEISSLNERLKDAMRFVPYPETMSGYCDPDAPDEVKELIALAAKLRGRTLPAIAAALAEKGKGGG